MSDHLNELGAIFSGHNKVSDSFTTFYSALNGLHEYLISISNIVACQVAWWKLGMLVIPASYEAKISNFWTFLSIQLIIHLFKIRQKPFLLNGL